MPMRKKLAFYDLTSYKCATKIIQTQFKPIIIFVQWLKHKKQRNRETPKKWINKCYKIIKLIFASLWKYIESIITFLNENAKNSTKVLISDMKVYLPFHYFAACIIRNQLFWAKNVTKLMKLLQFTGFLEFSYNSLMMWCTYIHHIHTLEAVQ